jgi:hypothetical protein
MIRLLDPKDYTPHPPSAFQSTKWDGDLQKDLHRIANVEEVDIYPRVYKAFLALTLFLEAAQDMGKINGFRIMVNCYKTSSGMSIRTDLRVVILNFIYIEHSEEYHSVAYMHGSRSVRTDSVNMALYPVIGRVYEDLIHNISML